MKNFRGLCFLGVVGAAFIGLSGGWARGQTRSALKTVELRLSASDSRLKTPLTFDADRMYLGEVLEKVSTQTGVSISIPDDDPTSGIPITVHLKQVPLENFMDSVRSLFSFSEADWKITAESQQNTQRYCLLPTAASRHLAEHLALEADQYTADFANLLLKMERMKPEERQSMIPQFTKTILLTDDNVAKAYIEKSPGSDRFWAMLHLFATELTPGQQLQVWKGDTVALPLSQLGAEDQAMLEKFKGHTTYTVRHYTSSENKPDITLDIKPDTIKFSMTRYSGQTKQMTKSLCIGVGSADGFVTDGYLGVLEMGLKPRIYERWLLPGDDRTTKLEQKIVNSLPALSQENTGPQIPAYNRALKQFAEGQNLSFIGVIPTDANGKTIASIGKPVQQYLEDLQKHEGLMHKWHDGVLLFNYPLWFYGDDAQYSYKIVKELRESNQQNDRKPLTLPNIADAVIELTDFQMKRLALEFPQVYNSRSMRPLFSFYKKYPGILGDEGMAVDLNMVALLNQMNLMPRIAEKESLERIRIVENVVYAPTDGRRVYRVQFRTASGKEWKEFGNFSIQADAGARFY